MKEKRKSIKINALLNFFNTILTISFSLLTYPYASRVLGSENLGKVNYSQSIVSYFALIAALGFSTYAINIGGRTRDDKSRISEFASQIFSLNLISLIVAYVFLGLSVLCIRIFQPYTLLIIIQSITMISAWIGVSWINVVFEDYLFITIRSILTQLLSIALLFIFVKDRNDYIIYAGITIFAHLLPSLFNYRYSKKYCEIAIVKKLHFKEHLPPVLLFFSNTIAVSIYLNSDITMLGLLMNDAAVGLYSVAVKIYSAIRTVIAAMYNVAIPRISNYVGREDWASLRTLLNIILNSIILVSVPASCISFCVAKDMVLFLSGIEYIEASGALVILSLAYIWAIVGGYLAYCVAVPLKKEKIVLISTIISAVENIVLNIFLIPLIGINGAALTTLLSEATVSIVLVLKLKDAWIYFDFKQTMLNCVKSIISSMPIFVLYYKLTIQGVHYAISDILIAMLGLLCFIFLNFILKNKTCVDLLLQIKTRLSRN